MIIASNFKMTHTRAATQGFFQQVDAFIQKNSIKHRAIVFPPATALGNHNAEGIIQGAQNAYPAKSGSFTGEIGLEQLEEFNIKTILIGHSERRHVLKESQESIIEKCNFFKEQGFEIVYCIGEPLEVKERGLEAVMEYNNAQLEGIDLEYERLIVAYEPVWAIGTGKSATLEDIAQIHKKLREKIEKPLLYGGSVKPESIKDITAIPEVDGALIGTASWEAENYCKMLDI